MCGTAPPWAEALRGVEAVVHHAAMVGTGLNVDDLPEYVSCNDLGAAVRRQSRCGATSASTAAAW